MKTSIQASHPCKRLFPLFLLLFLASVVTDGGGSVLRSSDERWEFAGWHGGGAYPAVIPDPNNFGRAYLISDINGVWVTADKGNAWSFRNKGLSHLSMATLAISDSNPDVLYNGTPAGMHRSADGGLTWTYLTSTRSKILFSRPSNHKAIAIDRSDPDQVFAGTKGGEIYYSEDGGQSFSRVGSATYPFGSSAAITALYLTRDNRFLFAGSSLGLIRYDRLGGLWQVMNVGGSAVYDIVGYQFSETIYINSGKKIAWSSDQGMTWAFSNSVPISSGYIYRIAVKNDALGNTKFAAAWKDGWKGGVYLSGDRGVTWVNIERNLSHDVVSDPTRVWAQGMGWPLSVSFDPQDADTLYFSDFWGVWRSDDNGQSWQERIKGAPNTVGSDIALTVDGSILVATMDNGLMKSTDSGLTYRNLVPNAGSGETVKGHVWKVLSLGMSGDRIVATHSPWNYDYNQVLISQDGGNTFAQVRSGLPATRPKNNTLWGQGYARALAVDPTDSNRLYLGIDGDDGGGFFFSVDGGFNWSRSLGQPASKRIYNGLAVDPTDPNRIYWGSTSSGGGVYRTENKGQSWARVFSLCTWVFDVAVSKEGVVYAAGDASGPVLYASSDRGATWKLLKKFGTSGPCEAIALDPTNPRRIAVSTVKWSNYAPGGVYLSEDKGATWVDITGDLEVGSGGAAMTFNPDGTQLYISKYNGSVYRLNVGGGSGIGAILPPTALLAELTSDRVNLTWTASSEPSGVTGYKIYRDGTEIGTTPEVYYQDSSIGGGSHTYGVKAFDATGRISVMSNTVVVTVQVVDTWAPSAPSNLRGSVVRGKINLTWDASTDNVGVVGYSVYRGNNLIGVTTSLNYLDGSVTAGVNYLYTVKAFDAAGNVSLPTDILSVTIPATVSKIPTTPANLRGSHSGGKNYLSWNASTDDKKVLGYNIYRNGLYYRSVDQTNASDSSIVLHTTYVYAVQAYDESNNKSGLSNTVTITVP